MKILCHGGSPRAKGPTGSLAGTCGEGAQSRGTACRSVRRGRFSFRESRTGNTTRGRAVEPACAGVVPPCGAFLPGEGFAPGRRVRPCGVCTPGDVPTRTPVLALGRETARRLAA